MDETSTLLKLLPYPANTIVHNLTMQRRLLKFLKLMLESAIHAIEDFYIKHDYAKFDAHIGDTSCQIRAAWLYYQAIQLTKNDIRTARINRARFRLELNKLKAIIINNSLVKTKKLTMGQVISRLDFKLNCSAPIILFAALHFLTMYTQFNQENKTFLDKRKLSEDCYLSRTETERLVKHLQVLITRYSSYFIRSIADHIEVFYLEKFIRFDSEKRVLLPYFIMNKILLRFFKSLGFQFCMCYQEGKVEVFIESLLRQVNAMLVIKVRNGAIITPDNFDTIYLANMAAHKQYSGLSIDGGVVYKNTPYNDEYHYFCQKASEWGCCLPYATGPVIQHVYCDNINRHNCFLKLSYLPNQIKLSS